jgi:hypothetical protein
MYGGCRISRKIASSIHVHLIRTSDASNGRFYLLCGGVGGVFCTCGLSHTIGYKVSDWRALIYCVLDPAREMIIV